MSSADVRTPEQKRAVIKCRYCDWNRPKYRQYDGKERQDVQTALLSHVTGMHSDKLQYKRVVQYQRGNHEKVREAMRIRGFEEYEK